MQRWYNNIDPALKDAIQSVLILDSADPPGPEDLPIFTNGMPALLCTFLNKEHRLSLFGMTIPTPLKLKPFIKYFHSYYLHGNF